MKFSAVVGLLTAGTAMAEVLEVGDFAQGAEFSKCIKITDFNAKTLSDEVEVTDKVDGCCPEGYIPGIEHHSNYWGAMVICGFKDDGSIEMKGRGEVKGCTYNKCYVVKMDITCADNSKMRLDGCCPEGQYTDTCERRSAMSQSFYKSKVGYCVTYNGDWKTLNGTPEKTDDQVTVDGVTSLSLTNLKRFPVCGTPAAAAPAPSGSGSGDAATPAAAAPAPADAPAADSPGELDADTASSPDPSPSPSDAATPAAAAPEPATTNSAVGAVAGIVGILSAFMMA